MDSPTWDGGEHGDLEGEVYPLFCEMLELSPDNQGRSEWKEVARWVKYEEDVEKGGQRWSKPYVPTLSLQAVYDLRQLLQDQTIMLNLETDNLERTCGLIVDKWANNGTILESERAKIRQTMLRRHVHLYESPSSYSSTFQHMHAPCFTRDKRDRQLQRKPSDFYRRQSTTSAIIKIEPEKDPLKKNVSFMRKIPAESESANIFIGELNLLKKPICAFVRLKDSQVLGNMTEVPLPTRFLFFILGPPGGEGKSYFEMGRAMGTLLTDPNFKEVAYHAENRKGLLSGIEQFLSTTTVLPPAGWDATIRLEPPTFDHHSSEGGESDDEHNVDTGLVRSGRIFGGLINDIKRKLPWYLSDYKDAISLQCLATWMFLYFACLTPMITFGGLMGIATNNYMGTMETIVSGCLCGIVFAVFSGQPLIILGSTGPVLVFEKILFQFCKSNQLDYLEFRLWVGIWIGVILIIFVATDASVFVSFITRFTEENFATLVALIFMVEAVKNVMKIRTDKLKTSGALQYLAGNFSGNETDDFSNMTTTTTIPWNFDFAVDSEDYTPLNVSNSSEIDFGQENSSLMSLVSQTANNTEIQSIFFMSLLLFIGTFFVSFMFKEFRNSPFFPNSVRSLISDFAVVIAIVGMSGVDMLVGVQTPKLDVPEKFAPTSDARGWIISPIYKNPIWSIFAAILPAILATILIFMDQQITAVIINRKDHKLRKGHGYHLDLFVLSILIMVCSVLGIPWFVAATVESLTNINSLKMDSDTAAPGEKPVFLGVREQRVSNILIFTTVGLSVFLTPLLKHVPMPVLYGVFLYMGFSALRRMELFERILLVFMPTKYQPEHNYLRQVPLRRVHLFTIIQITCLALLWVIKSVKATAILFPLMLVVMMIVRKLLDFVFTQTELVVLDDELPGSTKNERIRRASGGSTTANNNFEIIKPCEYKPVERDEV